MSRATFTAAVILVLLLFQSTVLARPAANGGIVSMGACQHTLKAATSLGLVEQTNEPDDEDDDDSNFLCLFTSSVQGSPLMDKVDVLRTFRDRFLASNSLGKVFVQFYYWASPSTSRFVQRRRFALVAIRTTLIPVVWVCEILVKWPERTLAFTSVFIGSTVFIISILARSRRSRKRAWTVIGFSRN